MKIQPSSMWLSRKICLVTSSPTRLRPQRFSGTLPSASLGGKTSLYEPAHGSAPDIAGQDRANPLAAILSTALLFRYSLQHEAAAQAIEAAVARVLTAGYRTPDLYTEGTTRVGTAEMGALVAQSLTAG